MTLTHSGQKKETCHINELESEAILMGLQVLCKDMVDIHIYRDKTIAVLRIKHGRSTKIDIRNSTEGVIHRNSQRSLILSATHTRGMPKIEANRSF